MGRNLARCCRAAVLVAVTLSGGCAYSNRLSDAELRSLPARDLVTLYEGEASSRPDWAYTKKVKALAIQAQDLNQVDAGRIEQGKIWEGMTKAMLILSWGPCHKKSTTTTRLGTFEIWDYGYSRRINDVYLQDGIVTGWTRANY